MSVVDSGKSRACPYCASLLTFSSIESKLGNSLTLAFLVSKRVVGHDLIQLEVVRMTMYEENSMKFLYNPVG